MKKRRKYDSEFKQMAVELSKHRKDLIILAEELDISPDLLYLWRREFLEHQETSFPGKVILSKRLRKKRLLG